MAKGKVSRSKARRPVATKTNGQGNAKSQHHKATLEPRTNDLKLIRPGLFGRTLLPPVGRKSDTSRARASLHRESGRRAIRAASQ